MRVLHVHCGDRWDGVAALLATLARCRDLAPEMQSEFAVCFGGRLRRELESAGAVVVELGVGSACAPWSFVPARRRLRRALAQTKYDVVVCHASGAQAMFGGVPRTLGVPEVFYVHDRVERQHCVERWAARHPPDWSLANTEFTRASLAGLFPLERSSVVPTPVESQYARPTEDERRVARAELGLNDDNVLVVQACQLAPSKGHERLLRALSRLPPPTSWFCSFFDDAEERGGRAFRARLEERARALGVTARLCFVQGDEQRRRLLAAADVLCQAPAEAAPFDVTLLEALQAGVPVITSAAGGLGELVTDAVGLRVTDEQSLGAALERLIADAELRRRLGAAGPARAKTLGDPASSLRELASVLSRVVGAPRVAPTSTAVRAEA